MGRSTQEKAFKSQALQNQLKGPGDYQFETERKSTAWVKPSDTQDKKCY